MSIDDCFNDDNDNNNIFIVIIIIILVLLHIGRKILNHVFFCFFFLENITYGYYC